jgi:hypothetical protein
MAAHSLTASEILEQVWACRERELFQKIADNHDITYETLLAEFGSNSAKSSLNMLVAPVQADSKKCRKCNVPQSDRCMARVWNGGKGGQCSRRGGKGTGKDLCGNHARCLSEKGELPQGRIDEDIPENMLISGDSTPKSIEDKKTVIQGPVDEGHLDQALKELIADGDGVSPEELSDNSSGKKKRGRPKGSKSKSKTEQDVQTIDTNGEIEEEELKAEISNSDITSALQFYLDGSVLSEVSLSSAKKAIHGKLNISKSDYDSKWFKSQFESMKTSAEEAQKILQEAKSEEIEQEEDSDDESEEVACKEIEVGGTKYLLDPETMKVYARESPNGFLGKYDGNHIDFDAVDSDDEEE